MDRFGEDDKCIFPTLFFETQRQLLVANTAHSYKLIAAPVCPESLYRFPKSSVRQNEIKPAYRYSLKAFCNSGGCHVLLRTVGR